MKKIINENYEPSPHDDVLIFDKSGDLISAFCNLGSYTPYPIYIQFDAKKKEFVKQIPHSQIRNVIKEALSKNLIPTEEFRIHVNVKNEKLLECPSTKLSGYYNPIGVKKSNTHKTTNDKTTIHKSIGGKTSGNKIISKRKVAIKNTRRNHL